MREHMPNVYFPPVIVDGRYQPELIASDVKDRKPAHLIRKGKRDSKAGEGGIVGLPNNSEPVIQRSPCIRMCPRELHQPLSRDDVHVVMLSQYEILVKRERARCRYEEGKALKVVRLHHVREEVIAV